jgi:probable F420-dependent oxidoreductase
MKYDILPPIGANVLADPGWVKSFAQAAEELGYDGIATSEHVVWVEGFDVSNFPYGDVPVTDLTTMYADPLELLAYLAAVTTRIDLVTATIVLPQQNPVVWAKRLATLDVLSGGRLRVGVGVGWNREEMETCGEVYTNRGARANEAMELMRVLWSGPTTQPQSYSGKHYGFVGVFCNPKPVRGDIPMFMGGSSEAAAIRAGRLGDGLQPLLLEGEDLTKMVELMRREAAAAGRDADALEVILRRSLNEVTPSSLADDVSRGCTRIILSGSKTTDLDLAITQMREFATRMGLKA